MVASILMLFAIIIFISTWFYFELRKYRYEAMIQEDKITCLISHCQELSKQLDLVNSTYFSCYVTKDSLGEELDKYYDEVEKRIKARKEEVWKSREKAFSMTKGNP